MRKLNFMAVLGLVLMVTGEGRAADFQVFLNLETLGIHDDVVSAKGFCTVCKGDCEVFSTAGAQIVGSGDWVVQDSFGVDTKTHSTTVSFNANPGEDPASATHYLCGLSGVRCKTAEGATSDKVTLALIKNDATAIQAARKSVEPNAVCSTFVEPSTVYKITGKIEDGSTDHGDLPGDPPTPKDSEDQDDQFEDIKLD